MSTLLYNIYNDWLVSTDELDRLRDIYLDFCQCAHKSNNQHTACQLWYALTGNRHRNTYYVPMPFLMRAVFDSESNKDKPDCRVLKLPDRWFAELLPPQRDAVFLLSASMCIEIRDQITEQDTCKIELWDIPRDFNVLALPAKRCHLKLFLRDLRYVSNMETEFGNTENEWLKGLPKKLWNEFKDEFRQTFWGL